jgi:membrane protein YfhO
MSALLYFAVSSLVALAADRYVTRLSRGAAIALLLLPLCFTGRALFTGGVYAPVDLPYATPPLAGLKAELGVGAPRNVTLSDLYTQIIPWRQAVRWSIAHGQWPLWNPFILSGDILAAAAQPAVYSPFTLIACLLPTAQSMTFTAAIVFFLAGLGAFLFLRELGCCEIVAVAAAAGWMYSTAISFFILWPIGASWALLPLLMLATRRIARGAAFRSAALLTLALVLLLLAGHPETVLHVMTCAAAYGIFTMVRARRWRAIGFAIGSGVVALLLCAIYLLPLLEAVPQTAEHEFRTAVWASRPRGITAANSAARLATDLVPDLHLRKWRSVDMPYVLPDTATVGSLLLACAIFGMWRVRSAESWFFLGLLVFCLIARAEPPWFEALMQKLPGFDVALNSRFSFGAAFCLVVLASLGLDHFSHAPRERGLAVTCAIVLLMLITLTATLKRRVDPRPLPWGRGKTAAEFITLALAIAVVSRQMRTETQLTLILALVLFQRTTEEAGAYPTISAREAYPPIPLLEPLRGPHAPFRIVGLGDAFPPGTSAMYGLEDVRGYEAMTLARYVDTYPLWCVRQPVWFNRVDDLTRPFLSFLNVRYAITADSAPVPEGWRELKTDRGARLLENTRALDRAFVPRFVRLGPSDDEMENETDFREHAWVRASLEPHQRDNGPGHVTAVDRGSELLIEADMLGNGWIVISEPAWKGWRAYVDGRRVEMQIANRAFLAVYVSEGKHDVRVVCLPRSFVVGRAITMAALAAIVIFALLRKFA